MAWLEVINLHITQGFWGGLLSLNCLLHAFIRIVVQVQLTRTPFN